MSQFAFLTLYFYCFLFALLLLCVITGLIWAISSMVGFVFHGSYHFCAECRGRYPEVKEENGRTRPRGGFPCLFIISPFVLLTIPLDYACYASFSFCGLTNGLI
ncbi:hypothetical protein BGX38DRAFT_751925 [Terfezia claveryi]|nr:hypothetical protein BGX38DRAFT_751925 [Terfezia claveryi]